MKRLLVVAAIAATATACLHASPTTAQWIPQTGPAPVDLHSVDFVDAQTGWIAGSGGTILHTTDAGAHWIPQTSNTSYTLLSVAFANASLGLAVGQGGTILRTTNAGAAWAVIRTDWMDTLHEVFVLDEQRAWAVGVNAIFAPFWAKTTNGGMDWTFGTFYLQSNEGTLTDVHFVSPTQGFATAIVWDGRGALCRSTDGGASWTTPIMLANALYAIDMASPLLGTAGGFGGTLLHTTDGGNAWPAQPSGTGAWIRGLDFPAEAVGFFVGDLGVIARTTNGGTNWVPQTSGTMAALEAVDFVDPLIGVVVGEGGTILRTVTGGVPSAGIGPEQPVSALRILTGGAPNPFSHTTTISYELDAPGIVRFEIFDALGRAIRVTNPVSSQAGRQSWVWDGTDDAGRRVARGAYLVRARARSGVVEAGKTLVFLGDK